jgi:hypothetical protein
MCVIHTECGEYTGQQEIIMKKLTIAAMLATIVAVTASTAFAAPQNSPRVPETSAERFQSQGNAEDIGYVLHR